MISYMNVDILWAKPFNIKEEKIIMCVYVSICINRVKIRLR